MSDSVIICPYNKSHLVARSRIQRHLVKCEKNYPPGYKQQCPYDATHRLFESEMLEHVENCEMRFMFNSGSNNLGRLPEISSENDILIESDEIWGEEDSIEATNDKNNPFEEPVLDSIKFSSKEYSQDGKSIVLKRFHSTLRPPHGYPESMMLDVSNQETDDDNQSVSSEMGVGRGQSILYNIRGHNLRGLKRGSLRGGR